PDRGGLVPAPGGERRVEHHGSRHWSAFDQRTPGRRGQRRAGPEPDGRRHRGVAAARPSPAGRQRLLVGADPRGCAVVPRSSGRFAGPARPVAGTTLGCPCPRIAARGRAGLGDHRGACPAVSFPQGSWPRGRSTAFGFPRAFTAPDRPAAGRLTGRGRECSGPTSWGGPTDPPSPAPAPRGRPLPG